MSDRRRSRRVPVSGKVLRAAVEVLDPRVLLTGNLDATFNGSGAITVGTPANSGVAVATVERADETRYVLTNLTIDNPASQLYGAANGFALIGLDPADVSSFGPSGGVNPFVFNILGGVHADALIDAATVTGGSVTGLYVVGTVYHPVLVSGAFQAEGDVVIVHVGENGQLDTSFGGGKGYRTYDLNGASGLDVTYGAGMDAAGQIVVAATTSATQASTPQVTFLKVEADGTPTSTFGTSGVLADPAYGGSLNIVRAPRVLAVTSTGAFYLGASDQDTHLGVTKYLATGARDTAFGTAGVLQTGLFAASSAVRSLEVVGPKLYIGGVGGSALQVVAVDAATGHTNSYSYSSNSRNEANYIDIAMDVSAAGQVAFAGVRTAGTGQDIYHLTATGSIDTAFNFTNSTIHLSTASRGVAAISFAPSGRTLVATTSDNRLSATATELSSGGIEDEAVSLDPVPFAAPTTVRAAVTNADGSSFLASSSVSPGNQDTLGFELVDRLGIAQTFSSIGDRFTSISVAGAFALPDGAGYAVVMSAVDSLASASNPEIVIGYFNSDGSVNNDVFSGGFSDSLPLGNDVGWTALGATLDETGTKVIVAGIAGSDRFLLQYNLSDASLDGSFGSGGVALSGGGGSAFFAVAVDKVHHRIFAAGNFEVDAFTSAGVLDTTWNSGGSAGVGGALSIARSVAVDQASGRLYVGGSAYPGDGSAQFFVDALNLNTGAVVTGFGGTGEVRGMGGVLSAITGIAVDTSTNDGSIIVAGSSANSPYVARYKPDGTVDATYASTFSPGPDRYGELAGVTLDSSGRALAYGQQETTTSSVRAGIEYRFQPSVAIAPTVTAVLSPAPKPGDTIGYFTLTFTAAPGLAIDLSTLPGAPRVHSDPPPSDQTAQLVRYRIVDPGGYGNVVEAVYSYVPVGGTFGGAGETYTFSVPPGSVKDEVGNGIADTALGQIVDAASATSSGNPSSGLGGTGSVATPSPVMTTGTQLQTIVDSAGFTYVLTNLSPIDFGIAVNAYTTVYGGAMVTRLRPDGTPDASFGTGGHFIFSEGLGFNAASLVDLGAGNGVVIAGTGFFPVPDAVQQGEFASGRVTVVKLTAAGALDASFGGKGFVNYAGFGHAYLAVTAGLDGLGNVVLVGGYGTTAPYDNIGLTTLSLASGADVGGATVMTPGFHFGFDRRQAAVDPSGIYLLGNEVMSGDPAIEKITFSGAVDNTFNGGNPEVLFDTPDVAVSLLVQGQYTYVAASTSGGSDIIVSRVDKVTGAFDANYGTSGGADLFTASGAFGTPALAGGPAGGILVAATIFSGSSLSAVYALDPSGNAVTTFGIAGVKTVSFNTDVADDTLVATDGSGGTVRLLATTVVSGGGDQIVVSALTGTGALDGAFNAAGATPGETLLPPAAGTLGSRAVASYANPDGSTLTLYEVVDQVAGGHTYLTSALVDRFGNSIGGQIIDLGFTSDASFDFTGVYPTSGGYVAFIGRTDDGGAALLSLSLTPAGALDASVGGGTGLTSLQTFSASVHLLGSALGTAGGVVFIVGSGDGDGLFARYNLGSGATAFFSTPNGTTPTAVATGGTVVGGNVVPQVYVAYVSGDSTLPPTFVRRYDENGVLDASWGAAGTLAVNVPVPSGTAFSVSAVGDVPSGPVYVAGTIFYADGSRGRFVVSLDHGTGAVNTSFGTAGVLVEDTGGAIDGVNAIVADASGLDVAGAAFDRPSIERLDPSGVVDTTYARLFNPSAFGTVTSIAFDSTSYHRVILTGSFAARPGDLPVGQLARLRGVTELGPGIGSLVAGTPRYDAATGTVSLAVTATGGLAFASLNGVGMLLVTTPGNATPVAATLVSSDFAPGATTVNLVYSFASPNATFGASQGTYTFSLATGAFPDEDGNVAQQAGQPIGAVNVAYVAPDASIGILGDPLLGAHSYSFSVTYSTARAIDLSTLAAGNVLVTLNGQAFGTVTFAGSTGSGGFVIANYTLVPDGGTFGPATAGSLVIATATTGAATDDLGTPVAAQTLYSRSLSYAPISASFAAVSPPRFGNNSYVFTVTYVATTGNSIDNSTFTGANVVAELDGAGFGTISLVGTVTNSDGSVTATYSLIPDNGQFTAASNGTLQLLLSSGRPVSDNEGNTNNPGPIKTFSIAFAPIVATVTTPAVPALGSTSLSFTVTYAPGTGRSIDFSGYDGAVVTVTGPDGHVYTLPPPPARAQTPGGPFTVTYVFNAPNGTFSLADVGLYTFGIPAVNTLVDDVGDHVVVGAIGSLNLQYGRPSASVVGTISQPNFGSPGSITVRFTPAPSQHFDPTYFAPTDSLRTTLGVTFNGTAATISLAAAHAIVANPDGSYDVTYLYTSAAGMPFGFSDSGDTYAFAILGGKIPDSGFQFVDATALGSLTVLFNPPTAVATFARPTLGSTSATFTVVFTAKDGATIDGNTIGDGDVLVTLPNGAVVSATKVSYDAATSTATYAFTSASGTFDNSSASSGTYKFVLVAGGVTDSRGVPVAAGSLGSLGIGGAPATLVSVTAPSGSFLPGQNISPSVTLTNPATDFPTRSFLVSFYAIIGGSPVLLGSFTVASVAAGATVTFSPPAGVPLPPSVTLPAGTYTIAAQVSELDGSAGGTLTSAPTQIAVVAPALPKPGTLDPTFGGGDGAVVTFVPTVKLSIVGSVSQDDVLIHAVGGDVTENRVVYSAGYNSTDGNLVLLRFRGDGSLDTTFGVNGILTIDLGGTDVAAQFVADPQQHRMILAGTSVIGGVTYFTVLRFDSQGNLDTTFGNAGVLKYVPTGATATQLRGVQADKFGRLYLLGSITAIGDSARQGVVVRLSASGLVDASFGSLGVISAAPNGSVAGVLPLSDGTSELTSLLLLDDRILVAGNSGPTDGSASRYVVAALEYNGQLDTTFGVKGLYLGALGSSVDRVTTVSTAPIGTAIYVGGSHASSAGTGATAVVFRLTAAGKLDRAFNKGAPLLLQTGTALSTVSSLFPSINNTMLITVATANSIDQAANGQIGTVIFRLTAAGANDPFFNAGAPLIVVDVPAVTNSLSIAAVGETATNFDNFIQSKQGAATIVTGGNVRAIAATPVADGTSLTIAQLTADGFDLSPVIVANIPGTLAKLPYKGSLKVTVSNSGSIASNGKFSVTLIGDTSAGTPLNLAATSFSGKIAAGGSKTYTLKFVIAKGTTPGTYTLAVALGTAIGDNSDANPGNNSTADDASFTIPGATQAKPSVINTIGNLDSWDPLPGLFATKKLFSKNAILA